MLTVTKQAFDHLAELQDGKDSTLRLTGAEDGSLALVHDRPRDGDEVHEHGGATLLVLDASVASALDARVLDVKKDRDAERLTLR